MSSLDEGHVKLVNGDVLKSSSHALVNTVNCVGVMGKGVAHRFKQAYPDMFKDYVARCDRGEVKLGRPYVYDAGEHLIVNFPTKGHWRAVSRVEDIKEGLIALKGLVTEWSIGSMAVPPLGCGNGQLDWSVVGPTLVRHLSDLEIPVKLFVPHEMSVASAQLELFESASQGGTSYYQISSRIDPAALALVEILRKVENEPYRWPVGRVKFQKLAYFATVAGIPTGLNFGAASYGPYAEELKRLLARLQNNGLVREQRRGRMLETIVGPTYRDAPDSVEVAAKWAHEIACVADLMARLDTTQCEIAATVHYAATRLSSDTGSRPSASEVIEAVEKWKVRRKPPLKYDDVGRALVNLATQNWIDVEADESVEPFIDELMPF